MTQLYPALDSATEAALPCELEVDCPTIVRPRWLLRGAAHCSARPRDCEPGVSTYVDWYQGERHQAWATPPEFFQKLDEEFGFTLDGASSAENALVPNHHTAEDIFVTWAGERVFCNPPWSHIPPFVELAATADLAVLLVPARTNCGWFHRALELGAVPRFWKGKLKFVGAKHTSPVDCLLLVWGAHNQDTREEA